MRRSGSFLSAAVLGVSVMLLPACTGTRLQAQESAAQPMYQPGVAFTADQISTLLPPSVYFQGRTAPLQLRNAGGVVMGEHQIVWASLVDSSGYATSIQEKYQFYLVSEGPLRVGGKALAAGAYGGGFVGNKFLIMDLGGHTVAEGPLESDAALQRPRPLQLMPRGPAEARLYLGRRWVSLDSKS